jgi:hypothetical protein
MMTGNPELLLSRQELIGLATLAGAQAVIGLEIQSDEIASVQSKKKEVDSRLSELGLLKRKIIPANQRAMIQTLFQPERALIVVRDRPDVGKQILIFLCRQKQCLLHSFPKENQHRIVEMNPDEIENMLKEWFPVLTGVASDAILLAETQLSELIATTNNGETPPLLPNIDSAISQKLFQSLQTRKWSASFLSLELQNGQAVNADSLTAWSGDSSVWVADLYNSSGVMRLLCGGDNFIGLRRLMVRRLAQFDKIVRAYRLSSEELAFALTLLNRSDLAKRILQSTPSQITDESWQMAAQNLQARGLSGVSPRGFPSLASDFEQALAPMVLHTRIGRIRTVSPQGNSEGTLYLLKDRFFCAHFVRNNAHVVESGNWGQFPGYLLSLFQGFGDHKIAISKPAKISLQALTDLLEESDQLSVEKRLRQAGLSKTLAASLAIDITRPVYRASMIGINTPRKDSSDRTDDHPTLLLLKGKQQDWVFSFPNEDAESIGQAMQADRKRLITEVTAILTPVSMKEI